MNTVFAFLAKLEMKFAIKENTENISFRIRVIYGRLCFLQSQGTTC